MQYSAFRLCISSFKMGILSVGDGMSRSTKISIENREKYIELGLNIAFYRKRLGMTQEQLAEKADISRSFLGDIEAPASVTTMSLEVLFNIAAALGIPACKLLEFRD